MELYFYLSLVWGVNWKTFSFAEVGWGWGGVLRKSAHFALFAEIRANCRKVRKTFGGPKTLKKQTFAEIREN